MMMGMKKTAAFFHALQFLNFRDLVISLTLSPYLWLINVRN